MLACIIVWRLVETHLFGNIVRIFHAAPALTEHSNSILLSVSFAQLECFFYRQGDVGRHDQTHCCVFNLILRDSLDPEREGEWLSLSLPNLIINIKFTASVIQKTQNGELNAKNGV